MEKAPQSRLLEYSAGAVLALAVTGIAFRLHFPLPAISSLYLLMIVLSAMRWGAWQATAVTLIAFFLLDYFFTQPLFSLRMDEASWVALLTFEFVGILTGRLSARARQQTRLAAAERNNTERLYQLGRALLMIDPRQPPARQIEQCIQRTTGVTAVAIAQQGEANRAASALGANSGTSLHTRVLRTGRCNLGTITLQGEGLSSLTADAIASIAAISLDHCRTLEEATMAEAARQGDQLRTAVLDALAHAFKTPLTAIRAASTGLLEAGLVAPAGRDLAHLIETESSELNELATRLLRTARLDEAEVPVHGEICQVTSLIDEVLERTPVAGENRLVRQGRGTEEDDLWVSGNSELIVVSLMQLVDNALKYSTPGSPVTIAAIRQNGEAVVSVHNFGTVIRPEDQKPIFERFYRAPGTEHLAAGTGLGLSITRKIAEAHGGRTWVKSEEASGTTFFLALPVLTGVTLP